MRPEGRTGTTHVDQMLADLNQPMIITMGAMRMMQVTVNQVIDMIAMWNCFMPA